MKSFVVLMALLPSLAHARIEFPTPLTVAAKEAKPLEELRVALKLLSGNECSAISKNGSKFALSVSNCLPSATKHLIGKSSNIEGPNCFNFAFMNLGIQSTLRYVSDQESEMIFNPKSGYCTSRKVKPDQAKPGFVTLFSKQDRYGVSMTHAQIHLTPHFALSKADSTPESNWQLEAVDLTGYPRKSSDGVLELNYFECSTPGHLEQSRILATPRAKLKEFSDSMQALHLSKQVTSKSASQIEARLAAFLESVDSDARAEIRDNRNDRVVSVFMHEVLAQLLAFTTLTDLQTTTGRQFIDSQDTLVALNTIGTRYADFVESVVSDTGMESMLSRSVFNSESAFGMDYCDSREWKPSLCGI